MTRLQKLSALFAFLAMATLAGCGADSASCPSGQTLCGSGCMPTGNDCCPDGLHNCNAGTTCNSTSTQCIASSGTGGSGSTSTSGGGTTNTSGGACGCGGNLQCSQWISGTSCNVQSCTCYYQLNGSDTMKLYYHSSDGACFECSGSNCTAAAQSVASHCY